MSIAVVPSNINAGESSRSLQPAEYPSANASQQHRSGKSPALEDKATSMSPWNRKAVLSFDGGGIKGYASLLILNELMKIIALKEQQSAESHTSSFAPWSDGPSQPGDSRSSSQNPMAEQPALNHAQTEPPPVSSNQINESIPLRRRNLSKTFTFKKSLKAAVTDSHSGIRTNRYLPCHYFDFIVGTSTGGLIAILLSRLRMDTELCIETYEELAGQVFGNPRVYIKGIVRTKYNEKYLEEAVKDVVRRRTPTTSENDERFKNFPAPEDLCKTFVVSVERYRVRRLPHLFRTYEHFKSDDVDILRGPRNAGHADHERIWKVARATSAAPNYLKKMKIHQKSYIDGSLGFNNPSVEAHREVQLRHPPSISCIALLVSIGTGNKPPSRRSQLPVIGSLLSNISELISTVIDPNIAHESVDATMKREGQKYFRWTPPESVGSLKLDQWRKHLHRHGNLSTQVFIRREVATYVAHPEIQAELNNCAEILIGLRRERAANRGKWRRYTLGTMIQHRVCNRRFNTDEDYEMHLGGCQANVAAEHLGGKEWTEIYPDFPGGPQ